MSETGVSKTGVSETGVSEKAGGQRRHHRLPFGAETGSAGPQFTLWAPQAETVELALDAADGTDSSIRYQPMPLEDGWARLSVPGLSAGQRYAFRINGDLLVPDPAARAQDDDVHGFSRLVDPGAYSWGDSAWTGRPWHEVTLYELHVGTFSPEGTFEGVRERLRALKALGITAIELMPVAEFPGLRNWGYDGVLWFAPARAYGRPEDLKRLIDTAHQEGLMVFLDVVYNHFGPEGNYLHVYARDFFTERHHTPWGAAINFDGARARPVRDFVIHNMLYWLEEYHLDGLRLDAVHAIIDDTRPTILEEAARAVRDHLAAHRHVHLVLENDDNTARLIERDDGRQARHYVAQWNDDIHHALHVTATGEAFGYYLDYQDDPIGDVMTALSEGFIYQGQPSPHRGGAVRGEASAHLPPTAFVSFIQNHDQVGNRAFGDRLSHLVDPAVVRALSAVSLLSPQVPLIFMGEEWAASTPFLFFCDFGPDLAPKVAKGRRDEFRGFPGFHDKAQRARIPDPADPETMARSALAWSERTREPHAAMLAHYTALLRLRGEAVTPVVPRIIPGSATAERLGTHAFRLTWPVSPPDDATSASDATGADAGTDALILTANLGDQAVKGSFPIGQPAVVPEHGPGAGDDAPPDAPLDAPRDATRDATRDAGDEADTARLPAWSVWIASPTLPAAP